MEQAPVVYGKYQLLELLARGGMAEVYKAKAHGVEGFEKILVIKRILEELGRNPDFVDMFINEAKIAVTLSHANIVQVFDLGRADETYFIAMEYVAGSDLATILRRSKKYGKPIPAQLAVFVVSEIAKGLDYAHRRRDANMRPLFIVHRDVSPQNILVSYEGEVKLTDFGIAKARTTVADETEAGVLKGKYAYMSPEQARGIDVDNRTDIFALGTVLYEALTGVNPFLTASTYETLQRVREGFPSPIREVAPQLPDELIAIVEKAMSPDPDDRHQNAGLFYEDLIQYLYSSRQRVGAHDVSAYVEALRVASDGRRSRPDDGLRAAFDIDTSAGVEKHQLTPAEVPSARPDGPRVTTGSGRRAMPRAERRDLTVLAVPRGAGDGKARSRLENAGGQVEEGDNAIFGVFGVVQPDGRDADAAARVGLSLQSEGYAVGIVAGRVVVNDSTLRRDDTSAELFRAAASLAQSADESQVLVSTSAERAMRRYFELAPWGEESFELRAERDVQNTSGPFVGRRDELRRIGEVLAVANKGTQCLVSVVGEAGSGKTRLIRETVRRIRVGGHDVGMTISTATGRGPYSAVQATIRDILGLAVLAQEEEVRDKVARLRELGLSEDEIAAVGSVLGVADAKSDRNLVSAVARIALKLAEDRLTVFAFDEFDKVDPESLALLQRILRKAGTGRIVIVVAHRPDAPFDWDEFPQHLEIRLAPLTDDDVARIVAARLGADEVPGELLREVGIKSAGNPLYVEEYLLALEDAGAIKTGDKVSYEAGTAVKVPRSLRGIVSARLERLSDDQRHLLRIAAVIGSRFHDIMISRVAGRSRESIGEQLLDLVDRGVLVQSTGDEYSFAHQLIAQVILEALPLEVKKELHGAVAGAFESVYPKHLDELAERLAGHHRKAGNRSRAIDYLVRSADRMESEHALNGSVTNLLKVIDMITASTNPDRERALALYQRVGELCFRSRNLSEGVTRMDAALELAESIARDEYVARFSMMRGLFLAQSNRFAEARPWFERARNVARRVGKGGLLGAIARAEAETEARNGNYQSAVGLLEEALGLAVDAADTAAQMRARLPLALAFAGSGDRDQAFSALEGARKLAMGRTDRFLECELVKTEALVCYFTGELDRALESGQRGIELAKEYGFTYEAAVNAHNVGEVYMRLGDFKRAFAMLRFSYDLAREHGYVKVQYNNMRVLGFIDATKLGSPQGRERVAEALTYAEENGFIWDIIQGRYMLAFVDHVQGKVDEARRAFQEVCQLANEYGQRHYEKAAEDALLAIEAGAPLKLPH
ncbi:MAG: protein kinase [Polyangiales bacterium]